jgi:hypothetical protein
MTPSLSHAHRSSAWIPFCDQRGQCTRTGIAVQQSGKKVRFGSILFAVGIRIAAPPAQIRASAIYALGSHIGCLTSKRCAGHG